VTQERYATPSRHTATPPTGHQPDRCGVWGLNRPILSAMGGASVASHHRQRPHRRRAPVRGPHVCNAQRRGSGHNPDPAKDASDRREHLQRTAEAAGTLHPGDHDCGLPTTTNVAWDGTDTPATATGWRTDILISTQRPHGASLDTSRGTPRSTSGHALQRRPRPHEGVLRNAAEQHKTPRHVGKASPGARGTTRAGHPLHDKGFPRSTRNQLEPTAAPPTTERLARRGTDRPRLRPHQWDALTYTDASRRRVKLPCGRAVIRLGAAVYTHGHRVQTVDRTQP
jgi:hypothetical protein